MHDASAHALEEQATSAVFRLVAPRCGARDHRGVHRRVPGAPPARAPAPAGGAAGGAVLPPAPRRPSFVDLVLRVRMPTARAEVAWPREIDQPWSRRIGPAALFLVREIERALGLPAEARRAQGRHRRRGAPQARAARGAGARRQLAREGGAHAGHERAESGAAPVRARHLVPGGPRRGPAGDRRGAPRPARRQQQAEVAFATGFSEVAAFTRAFRRWSGVAPSQFLRAQAAGRRRHRRSGRRHAAVVAITPR